MLPAANERWTHWADPFAVARRDLDGLLQSFFGKAEPWTGAATYPVDIHEDAENLYVEAELPGFQRDEIDVTLEKGILSITAERKLEAQPKEKEAHLQERRSLRYARRFSLPVQVAEGAITARLDSGVLHLTLPKKEEAKPRRIEVK